MSERNLPRAVNPVLLLLVGLLAGVIAGYWMGVSLGPRVTSAQSSTRILHDAIASENQWILEGLSCPVPGCSNPLLVCDAEISRQIRAWVNDELSRGRAGAEIREEVIRVHGSSVLKLPGGIVDTSRAID